MGVTDATPDRPRRRSLVRRVGTALAVLFIGLLAGLVVFAWRVVYHPHFDELPAEPVDALIVLGPLDAWRVPMADRLMREGRARNLVLSTPFAPPAADYCDQAHDWPTFCFVPDPSTTRGEAMELKRLAGQHGWTTFAVVTIDLHAERTRFIFKRCLGVDVPVVGQFTPRTSSLSSYRRYHVAYQLAGYVKEIALGKCPA